MSEFIVTGAQVFDGVDLVPGAPVLVRGSRIEAVGDVPVPEGVEVVDGRGATLLPGLIDNHSHVCPPVLETSLAFGVTTEIDLFSFPDWMVPLKAEAARRDDMADVRSCMFGVTVHGGHPSSMIGRYFPYEFPTVADASQVPSFVAARIAEAADCIKLFIDDGRAVGHSSPTMTREMAGVVVDEAHEHGVLCVAHIASIDGARQAIEAGVDALAHVPRDVAPTPEIIEIIASAGVFVTPRRWRMDDRGRIERGRQADLLLVDGDPLADVANLLKIKDVWRRGTRFDRKTYDGNRAERERLSAEWATKPAA